MLQRAPHMLQCTPPTGHAVTKNIYIIIMKQRNIFVLDKCEIKVYKKNYTRTPRGFTQSKKV